MISLGKIQRHVAGWLRLQVTSQMTGDNTVYANSLNAVGGPGDAARGLSQIYNYLLPSQNIKWG